MSRLTPPQQHQQRVVDSRMRQQPGNGPRPDHVQFNQRGPSRPDDEKRNSGVGGIGMGMLAGGDSDDEDDDRIAPPQQQRIPQRPPPARQASNNSSSSHGSPPRMNGIPAQSRAPPPGLHPPHPAMSPPPPGPVSRPTQALQPAPQLAHPRAAFMPPIVRPGTTEPHALAASPSTPIVAKFQVHDDAGKKNRTTVFGDEFWMRFNKMADDEKRQEARQSKGQNSFMREYAGGTTRLSKWVWCCSIVLLLAIVGGIVAGWYFSRNEPVQPPSVFGGSDNMNSITPATDDKTTSARAGAQATATGTPDRRRAAVHRRRLDIAMEQLD